MVSVSEAFNFVLSAVTPPSTLPETLLFSDNPDPGFNAHDLLADRDFPPFDRVAMDGIAIVHASWAEGQRSFEIQGLQAAGQAPLTLTDPHQAIEVMTGAVLPTGCDTVIRYEDLVKEQSWAHIMPQVPVKKAQNVHSQGRDAKQGTCLVPRGASLRSPQWALAATIGLDEVATFAGPRISIIGTGDELVSINDIPLPHQIRASNAAALIAAARERGFRRIRDQLVSDRVEDLMAVIGQELELSDFCILTGAVSMGRFDLVPTCLKESGVREVFHKVRQRPGKPLWFGKSYSGTLVFGLPGNPVSALMAFYKYVLPALYAWQHPMTVPSQRFARLSQAIHFDKGEHMSLFAPVCLEYGCDAVLYARPLEGIGSGDLASLAHSDGFIECQEGTKEFPEGTVVPVYAWGLQ